MLVNQWLLNQDAVDKVLACLREKGLKMEEGECLGKTIIFAKNQRHAEFVQQRFDARYLHYKGQFAQVIHVNVSHVQDLIDVFFVPNNMPHIAISMDMMDTGIDVHEIVNLVFFKLVRSRGKFWQMVGRGTRLCLRLFGPNNPKDDKTFFYIFDFCENLEYFGSDTPRVEARLVESLSTWLFIARVALVAALDKRNFYPEHRAVLARGLPHHVVAMNFENLMVSESLREVEHYR